MKGERFRAVSGGTRAPARLHERRPENPDADLKAVEGQVLDLRERGSRGELKETHSRA